MKKKYILVLCVAMLCTGLIYGSVFAATAEQEEISHETQIEESENLQVPESGPPPEDPSASETSEPSDIPLLSADSEDGSELESLAELEEEQDQANSNVLAAMQAAHDSLDAYIIQTADLLEMPGGYTYDVGEDNFFDALTVYALRHGQTENSPYAIKLTEEDEMEELASIYWSLNPVNGSKTEVGSIIQIRRLSGRNYSGLTAEDMTRFSELHTVENKKIIDGLLQQ